MTNIAASAQTPGGRYVLTAERAGHRCALTNEVTSRMAAAIFPLFSERAAGFVGVGLIRGFRAAVQYGMPSPRIVAGSIVWTVPDEAFAG